MLLLCPVYITKDLQCLTLSKINKKINAFKGFANSRKRMVPKVRRTLVSNTWTTDREGTFPELSPCSRDNCCFGTGRTELARPDSVELNFIMLLRYAGAC